jgi:hypothetical protein
MMEWTVADLGSIGEFVGAIATIATLAYLAVQIRHNSRVVKAQTRANIGTATSDIILREAENLEIVRALAKVEAGEDLSREETLQLRMVATATFRHWENVYYQYRQGLYDSGEFEAHRQTWRRLVVEGWLKYFWKQLRPNFSAELRALVDKLASESNCGGAAADLPE